MSIDSSIEWTESTWNPVTGCTKVSEGCDHCYAERMAGRLQAMGAARYRDGFQVTCHPESLELPLKWRSPRVVFVNSMGDLFHPEVPDAFIRQTFSIMVQAKQHVFQLLTKRSERMREMAPTLPWPRNLWMGVTVESHLRYHRIDDLLRCPAPVRFLSCEPLLSALPDIPLRGLHWVIAGGESGPQARPMNPQWVRQLRDTCVEAGVSFYFKQWGGPNKAKRGRLLDGQLWSQMPELNGAHPVSKQMLLL